MKLTQKEKCVKIVEARGWRRFDRSYIHMGQPCICIQWEDRDGNAMPLGDAAVPDFFNDIVAIRSLVQILVEEDQFSFIRNLCDITRNAKKRELRQYVDQGTAKSLLIALATPFQWTEAYGLTLNLWEAGQ